jgi:hypothetical protein
MTKKFTLLTLALIFTSIFLNAQSKINFGASGGMINPWIINQNNYGLDFEMDYVAKIGGNGQISIGYDFNKNIGLRLDLGYATLGQNYKDTHQGAEFTREINLNYFQLPLLFKFRTSGETVRFYAAAGPQFDFLMSAKQKYYKNDTLYNEIILNPINNQPVNVGQEDIKDRYESMDIMIRLDLGVEITLVKNLYLNAGMTSAYGLLDINAADYRIPDHSSGDYNPSHNVYGGFNVGINYCIPVGKGD